MWWHFEILQKISLEIISTGRCWAREEWEARMLAAKQAEKIGGVFALLTPTNGPDPEETFANNFDNPLDDEWVSEEIQ